MSKATVKPLSNTDREKVVEQIISLRNEGKGYPAIAKVLNEQGTPTFGGGKTWHPPVVRGICIKHFGSADESKKVAGTTDPRTFAKKTSATATAAGKVEAKPDPKAKTTRPRKAAAKA